MTSAVAPTAGRRRAVAAPLAIACALATVPMHAGPAAAVPKTTIPGSGTYLVGRDFDAGVYRSIGNTSCYWARATNAGGSLSSIRPSRRRPDTARGPVRTAASIQPAPTR